LFDSCSARNRATTPWRPPPESENGSPGAVGTATGADIQRGLQKTNQSYPNPNVNIASTADLHVEHSAFSQHRRPHVRRGYDSQHPVVLLEVTLRDAIAALRRDVGDTETPDPHQNTAASEATTPSSDMVTPPVAAGAGAEHGVVP